MAYTITFAWEDIEHDKFVYDKTSYDSYATAIATYFVCLLCDWNPEIYRDGKLIEDEVLYDEDLFKKCFYDDKNLLILFQWDTLPYEDLWNKVVEYRRLVALYKKFN